MKPQTTTKPAKATGTNQATPATPAAIPAEVETMQSRLHSLKSEDVFSMKAALMETATRNAKCDVDEANAELELQQLEHIPDMSADDKRKIKRLLFLSLESISTIRKLGNVLDGLHVHKDELDKALAPAIQAEKAMEELRAAAATLETKITAMRARDIRGQEGELGILEDQLRWAGEVYHCGEWRKAMLDYKADALAEELERMSENGRYKGEFTEAGLEARYEELQPLIEECEKRWENSLSPSEMNELAEAEAELEKINEEMRNQAPNFEELSRMAQVAEEVFTAHYDATLITFNSVLEVHRIHYEMIETSSPG